MTMSESQPSTGLPRQRPQAAIAARIASATAQAPRTGGGAQCADQVENAASSPSTR